MKMFFHFLMGLYGMGFGATISLGIKYFSWSSSIFFAIGLALLGIAIWQYRHRTLWGFRLEGKDK